MKLLLFRGERFDPNFYYETKTDIDNSFLLMDIDIESGRANGEGTLFVSEMNETLARSSFDGDVIVYKKAIDEIGKRLRKKTVLADLSKLNVNFANRFGKYFKLRDYSKELLRKRSVKTKDEVGKVSRAVKITKEIFDLVEMSIESDKVKTELDLQKVLMVETAERGLERAFGAIVSSDEHSSYPHHEAQNKKLGSLVMVDYGVRFEHYCSDITRCFIRKGDPGSVWKKKTFVYESLQNILQEIVDELPNLEKGKDVGKFAAKLMKKAKFPPMIHSVGHGLGMEVHEAPGLNFKSDDSIKGAVLAIEPAVYFRNRYGLRYEETVYFDGKKGRIL